MKRVLCALMLTALVIGCQPQQQVEEISPTVYPYDLRARVSSGMLTLAWKLSGEALLSGYNIYITDYPLAAEYPDGNYPDAVKPFNLTVYPGDTDPDDAVVHFEAKGLDNGHKYYVSVRAVYPDRSMSRPSNEIMAVPGPRGEITLDLRYQGDHDGYSFTDETYVAADNVNNDIYFYWLDGKRYLASPSRLDGFLRESRFLRLSFTGDEADVAASVVAEDPTPDQKRVAVGDGDWVLMRTADGQHVLLHILGFIGSDKEQKVRLGYVVSTLTGEIFF